MARFTRGNATHGEPPVTLCRRLVTHTTCASVQVAEEATTVLASPSPVVSDSASPLLSGLPGGDHMIPDPNAPWYQRVNVWAEISCERCGQSKSMSITIFTSQPYHPKCTNPSLTTLNLPTLGWIRWRSSLTTTSSSFTRSSAENLTKQANHSQAYLLVPNPKPILTLS